MRKAKFRNTRHAVALTNALYDQLSEFEQGAGREGLSDHEIDAHIAAVLIDLLIAIVATRKTFTPDVLLGVLKEEIEKCVEVLDG